MGHKSLPSEAFCSERGLKILSLRNLVEGVLHLDGTGDITIPYQGCVDANLAILDLPKEDVLFLVVANHKYGDRVPIQIGTHVIDQLVASMTEKELQKAGETWRQVHLSTIVLKRSTIGSFNAPKYYFGKGMIHTMKEVMIPPLTTIVVTGMADLTTHLNSLNVVVEPVFGYFKHTNMARSYGELTFSMHMVVVWDL